MDIFLIFITAFIVGLSGAMMPGPVTAAVADHSMRHGFIAGPMAALGHGVLEVFVIVLLVSGLGQFMEAETVAGGIGIGGGFILVWMGYGMIRSAASGSLTIKKAAGERKKTGGPFVAGILTTLSNPYWLVWWITVGAGHVIFASKYGSAGIIFFFTGHILSDLFWFSLLALVFVSGKKFITDRIYAGIIAALGTFLLIFAAYFFWTGINFLRG